MTQYCNTAGFIITKLFSDKFACAILLVCCIVTTQAQQCIKQVNKLLTLLNWTNNIDMIFSIFQNIDMYHTSLESTHTHALTHARTHTCVCANPPTQAHRQTDRLTSPSVVFTARQDEL